MIIEFDTRYLKLFDGNLKAAMMLAIAVKKQMEFNEENEPDRFGHNFWPLGHEEWKSFGFGTRPTQEKLRNVLNHFDFYRERIWGRNRKLGRKYREGRSCPPRMEYFIDLEKLEEVLKQL